MSNTTIESKMHKTRDEIHRWGVRNRVTFDPTKEHVVVIHPLDGNGEVIKFLGTLIDPQLTMQFCIESILSKIKPKIKAALRTRAFYDIASMVGQFKIHIWSHIEFHYGAILHAAPSSLSRIDDCQRSFVRELNISAEIAYLEYNFPLPTLRRDIGLLGLLHKRVLGLAHPAFEKLFPYSPHPAVLGHNKQLHDYHPECNYRRALLHRSIFGLVAVYNLLPQYIVDSETISAFQTALTHIAKTRRSNQIANLHLTFNAHYHSRNDIDVLQVS